MGDRITTRETQVPESNPSLLEGSGWMDKLKHGAQSLKETAGSVIHKGVEAGSQIAHSDAAKSLKDTTANVVHKGIQKGTEIANHPTTRMIAGEAAQAGREIVQDKVRNVKALGGAVQRHDVAGVVREGLPLAGDVLLPGVGKALPIAGRLMPDGIVGKIGSKIAERAIQHGDGQVPNQNNDGLPKQRQYADGDAPQNFPPPLTIDGHEGNGKKIASKR